MKEPDLLAALAPVVDAMEALGVRYQIGGSVASSVYGMARATMDVDLMADLRPEHVDRLVALLEVEYFADEGMIRLALDQRSSFNLIHLATMMKVDVFLPERRPYDEGALERSRPDTLADDPRSKTVQVASPEDVVLRKLEWYRIGGEVSERQWIDLLGVLKVQGASLDLGYLRRWSIELEVADLLERALDEAQAGGNRR